MQYWILAGFLFGIILTVSYRNNQSNQELRNEIESLKHNTTKEKPYEFFKGDFRVNK